MMDNLCYWMTIFFVACLIDWTILKYLLDRHGVVRVSMNKYWIIWLGMVVLEALFNLLSVNIYVKLLLLVGIMYLFGEIAYKIDRKQSILSIAIFVLLSVGLEGISLGLGAFYFNLGDPLGMADRMDVRTFYILISKGLMIIGYIGVRYFESWEAIWQKEVGYILSLLISNIFVLFFIFENTAPSIGRERFYYTDLVMITLLIAIANIVLFLLMLRFNKTRELKIELEHYEEKIEQQYNYYAKLEKEHEKVRLLYHDMNNHLACMKSLSNDNEKLNRYLERVEEELKVERCIYQTGNCVVDTILIGKSSLCENKKIQFDAKMDLKSCNFIEDKDLCSIISNALDNAIEACEHIENTEIKPAIVVEGGRIHDFIIIKIINAKDKVINDMKGKIITDKGDSFAHGLGLTSIRKSVEKYQGEMSVKYTSTEFRLNILIPIPKKQLRTD